MRNTITEALIYENQGLKAEAIEIFKNILAAEPDNFKAAAHLRRLSKEHIVANEKRLAQFLSLNGKDNAGLSEFKKWLVEL